MKSKIKIAAIHSRDKVLPWVANPHSSEFDAAAPKKLIEGNIEEELGFLHAAGREKVDLVCTHEDFKGSGVFMTLLDYPGYFSDLAEEIPGPTSQKLGEIAKLYGMHVAANYHEKDGERIYNTTVLIGRSGGIIGKYRKVHLPASEKWRVTSGKEFTVVETDIGRIGFATCYDIYFSEHCRTMALNGADIIIHQTQGWGIVCNEMGEALVRTRAAENSVYMLVSKNIQPGDGGKSCIINNYGNILAEAPGGEEKVIAAEFEPDFDMIHEDHYDSLFSGVNSFKARQALERVPSLYSIFTDENPPVLAQYKGLKLQTSHGEAEEVFRRWREYEEDLRNNRPVKMKYHW